MQNNHFLLSIHVPAGFPHSGLIDDENRIKTGASTYD